MIDLITGLPGNAKTCYTIAFVKAWSERENRPVYYSGIPGLTLAWTEIDPEKWMDVPPQSIVVIDECQRIYRNRSINAQAPKFVTDLETHRHLGIDLVFITQHPMLVDPALRRLCGRHRHLVRIWGMEASTVHEWSAVKEGCDKPAMRKDSEKTKWVFDKSIYPLYKSAEAHTMKRSIPMRLKLLLLVPLVIAGAVWLAWYLMFHKPQQRAAEAKAQAHLTGDAVASVAPEYRKHLDPVEDAKEYMFQQTPRVVGLPQTAPKYDELTKPTAVPVPAACVSRGSGCKCYTQQGTRMDVPEPICLDIVQHGFFQEFDPDGRRDRDVRVLGRSDAVPVPSGAGAASVSSALGGAGSDQIVSIGIDAPVTADSSAAAPSGSSHSVAPASPSPSKSPVKS